MKKTTNILFALVALAVAAAPLTVHAHCGTCGVGNRFESRRGSHRKSRPGSKSELRRSSDFEADPCMSHTRFGAFFLAPGSALSFQIYCVLIVE